MGDGQGQIRSVQAPARGNPAGLLQRLAMRATRMQCAAVCGVGRSAFRGLAKCKSQVTSLAVAARALLTVAGAERGGPQARMGAASRQGMRKGGVCAFLGIIAMTFIRSQAAAGEIQVKTAAGILSGSAQNGVESFKGIPFAAPPVGQL